MLSYDGALNIQALGFQCAISIFWWESQKPQPTSRDLESDHHLKVDFVNLWDSLVFVYNCRGLRACLIVLLPGSNKDFKEDASKIVEKILRSEPSKK